MTSSGDNLLPYVDETTIATGVASRFIDRLLSAAEDKLRKEWAKRKKQQAIELARFIAAQAHDYKYIKNILYYNDPVELETLYIPLSFSRGPFPFYSPTLKDKLSDEQIFQIFQRPSRTLICATAGAGKSFFMRKALQSLSSGATAPTDRIPIFFELRNLNGKPKQRLTQALTSQIQEHVPSFMSEQLHLGLETGAFILMLDGYDEIDPANTDHYEAEILSLARQYPKASIVVSSRPMESILAWEKFRVLHILPLSKSAAIELIQRLPFDESVKAKFIEATDDYLYDKHKSFMSTPLLITMMLITFSETAEINSRLTTFYNDAFHALFIRHDAKKEAFRRTLASNISREEFERLFAAFCFLTYSANQYHFQEAEALRQIRTACDLLDIEANPELLFQDFCVTSCMLVKEGNRYVFSHRSFQEYFAAVFIHRCPQDIAVQLLKELSARADRDNVLDLLLELNPELVEMHWVLPRLKAINKTIDKFGPDARSNQFVRAFFHVDIMKRKLPSKEIQEYWAISVKGQMGFNMIVIARLYGFPIFDSLDLDSLPSTIGEAGSRGGRGRKTLGIIRGVPRKKGGNRPPEATDAAIHFLRSQQDRIETSYARKKTKLVEIVANAKLKRRELGSR